MFVSWSGLLILEFKSLMRGEVYILGHFVLLRHHYEGIFSRKLNILEEIEILKAASFKYLLNDVIAGPNDPIYKVLPTSAI